MNTIRDREAMRQIKNFSGFGDIGFTDIDGVHEEKNNNWIFFELKHESVEDLGISQRWTYKNLTDNMCRLGKNALFLLAEHNVPVEEEIDVANDCRVIRYRYEGQWQKGSGRPLLYVAKNYLKRS